MADDPNMVTDDPNADPNADPPPGDDPSADPPAKAKADPKAKPNGSDPAAKGDLPADDPPAEPADWRALLTDEKAKKLAGKYESLDALVQGVSKLQSQLSDRIKLPGKDATDEDTAKFRKAMGIPEKADDYKIELPEGMEIGEDEQAVIDALKPIAHEENLPASAFSRFVQRFKEFEQQVINEHQANLEKARESAEAELKKEMGKDYEPNMSVAVWAARDSEYGSAELFEAMETETTDGRKVGNIPAVLRHFAKLGRVLKEDGAPGRPDAETKQTLKSDLARLTREAMAAQRGGDTAKADKLFKERQKIADRLYGEEPIVGAAGRSA